MVCDAASRRSDEPPEAGRGQAAIPGLGNLRGDRPSRRRDHDPRQRRADRTADQPGAPFQTVAGQFSQSPSAADGGDIGWVVQGQLAEELDHALSDLRPGQITGRSAPKAVITFCSCATAASPSAPRSRRRKPRPPPIRTRLFRWTGLLIPLPPNPDAMLKERAMTLANNVKSQVRSCADLPVIASQLQGTVYTKLGTHQPQRPRSGIARCACPRPAPGEVVPPFFSPAGLELIMRCDAAPPKLVAFELPTARAAAAAALRAADGDLREKLSARPKAGRRCRDAMKGAARSFPSSSARASLQASDRKSPSRPGRRSRARSADATLRLIGSRKFFQQRPILRDRFRRLAAGASSIPGTDEPARTGTAHRAKRRGGDRPPSNGACALCQTR